MNENAKDELIQLLKNGKIKEFNQYRKDTGFEYLDLSWCNLKGSNLSGSNLSGSDLRWSNLSGSNLSGSDLRGSDLSGSDLRGSDLSGSDLSGSDLRGSYFSRADLRGSCFSRADLRHTLIKTILNTLEFNIYFVPKNINMLDGYCQIGCKKHTHKEWIKIFKKNEYIDLCESEKNYNNIKKMFRLLIKLEKENN